MKVDPVILLLCGAIVNWKLLVFCNGCSIECSLRRSYLICGRSWICCDPVRMTGGSSHRSEHFWKLKK